MWLLSVLLSLGTFHSSALVCSGGNSPSVLFQCLLLYLGHSSCFSCWNFLSFLLHTGNFINDSEGSIFTSTMTAEPRARRSTDIPPLHFWLQPRITEIWKCASPSICKISLHFFFLFKCCEELVNISLVILQLQVLHDLSLASEKLRLVMLPWEGISQRGYKTKYLTPLWSLLPIHPNAALQAKSQQITTIQLWASQNRRGQLGALLLKSRCTGTPPDPCKYAREK